MANKFSIAFDVLLSHEGGFVNNPLDKGGPTNMGLGVNDISTPNTIEHLKSLSKEEARLVYFMKFWMPHMFDYIQDQNLATVVFDQAVLNGPERAIKRLQNIVQAKEDGKLGPSSSNLINTLNPKVLALKFIERTASDLVDFTSKNPEQIKFLGGWVSRLFDLTRIVFFS